MWGRRKPADKLGGASTASDHPPILSWRDEVDFANAVTKFVNDLFEDRSSFAVLSGAVFALQQDMKLAMNVNLWDATNLVRPVFAEQRTSLPPTGAPHSQDRLSRIIDALDAIMKLNAEFCEKYRNHYRDNPPSHLEPVQLQAEAYLSGLRNRAGAIWLLTVMPSSSGADMVQLAATNVWLRLSMIRVHELLEWSEMATGKHFNDVTCQSFASGDWPRMLDQRSPGAART